MASEIAVLNTSVTQKCSVFLTEIVVSITGIMAKNYAIVDASVPRPKEPCITNWTLCVLCQEDTNAALQCPAKSKDHQLEVVTNHWPSI